MRARCRFGGGVVAGRWLRKEIHRVWLLQIRRLWWCVSAKGKLVERIESIPVESSSPIEELEMEWCGCLAVDLAAGARLHGHGDVED